MDKHAPWWRDQLQKSVSFSTAKTMTVKQEPSRIPNGSPSQRGSVDTFLLTTPYILGPLPYIRIWHDNSGGSWFLSRVMVIDLQTDEHYYFICNRWLAVDEDDGQVWATNRILSG